MAGTAQIHIAGVAHSAADGEPFVFGRSDAAGVVGLNPEDMGVSGVAGSVELAWGVWWVVNQSAKRRLLIESSPGSPPTPVECGHRSAIVTERVRVLVPGALYTYALEVLVDAEYSAGLRHREAVGSGTIVPGADVGLSEADRTALAALFAGYLEPWPHRREVPNGYDAAARLAGPGWSDTTLRKRIERIRDRYQAAGLYFDGDRAREELAAHLITNGLLTGADLDLLAGRSHR